MEKECPFWAQARLCNSNKCTICECGENEVPAFWKQNQKEQSLSMSWESNLNLGLGGKPKDLMPAKPTRKHEFGKKSNNQDEWCENDEQ